MRLGFGSPLDGDIFTFSICENCVYKLFSEFKIKPEFNAGPNSCLDDLDEQRAYKTIEELYGIKIDI